MRSTFEETVLHETSVNNKNNDVLGFFLEGGFGRFRRDFVGFVRILAWSRDGK